MFLERGVPQDYVIQLWLRLYRGKRLEIECVIIDYFDGSIDAEASIEVFDDLQRGTRGAGKSTAPSPRLAVLGACEAIVALACTHAALAKLNHTVLLEAFSATLAMMHEGGE
jgi:hypothetical protein